MTGITHTLGPGTVVINSTAQMVVEVTHTEHRLTEATHD